MNSSGYTTTKASTKGGRGMPVFYDYDSPSIRAKVRPVGYKKVFYKLPYYYGVTLNYWLIVKNKLDKPQDIEYEWHFILERDDHSKILIADPPPKGKLVLKPKEQKPTIIPLGNLHTTGQYTLDLKFPDNSDSYLMSKFTLLDADVHNEKVFRWIIPIIVSVVTWLIAYLTMNTGGG